MGYYTMRLLGRPAGRCLRSYRQLSAALSSGGRIDRGTKVNEPSAKYWHDHKTYRLQIKIAHQLVAGSGSASSCRRPASGETCPYVADHGPNASGSATPALIAYTITPTQSVIVFMARSIESYVCNPSSPFAPPTPASPPHILLQDEQIGP
jgi:hypothetical protein